MCLVFLFLFVAASPLAFEQLRQHFQESRLRGLSEYDFVNMASNEVIAAIRPIKDPEVQANLMVRYLEYTKKGVYVWKDEF